MPPVTPARFTSTQVRFIGAGLLAFAAGGTLWLAGARASLPWLARLLGVTLAVLGALGIALALRGPRTLRLEENGVFLDSRRLAWNELTLGEIGQRRRGNATVRAFDLMVMRKEPVKLETIEFNARRWPRLEEMHRALARELPPGALSWMKRR